MKCFRITGYYHDVKGVSHAVSVYIYVKRTKRADGTYQYRFKDDFYPEEIKKTNYKIDDRKKWDDVVFTYFIEKYELNFGALSVEEVKI